MSTKRPILQPDLSPSASSSSLNCRPHPYWGRWHIQFPNAQRSQSVQHGVHDCLRRSDTARLAGSFRPKRIRRRWNAGESHIEIAQIRCSRQAVVLERSHQGLRRVIVEAHFFEERLPDALARPPCTWPCVSNGFMSVP